MLENMHLCYQSGQKKFQFLWMLTYGSILSPWDECYENSSFPCLLFILDWVPREGFEFIQFVALLAHLLTLHKNNYWLAVMQNNFVCVQKTCNAVLGTSVCQNMKINHIIHVCVCVCENKKADK